MNKTYLLLVALSFFTVSCKTKEILWDQECLRRFPPTTKFIEGKTIIETDTIYEGNLIIQSDPILIPGKCPPNRTITITKRRIDTIETESIGIKAKISLLERKSIETEDRLHSSQQQTLEALKIVDEERSKRKKSNNQRNLIAVGLFLSIGWNFRKLISRIISPFL